jgi:prepilin-type N-terminal cleavage/methylation domain-containing protein
MNFKEIKNIVRSKTGFTLIEMLVVVSIMAVLGGVAIMAYIGYQERSRQASIRASVHNAASEIQGWMDHTLDGEPVDLNGDGQANPATEVIPVASLNTIPLSYVNLRNGVTAGSPFNDQSPWNPTLDLWFVGAGVAGNAQIGIRFQLVGTARTIIIEGATANAADGIIFDQQLVAD